MLNFQIGKCQETQKTHTKKLYNTHTTITHDICHLNKKQQKKKRVPL